MFEDPHAPNFRKFAANDPSMLQGFNFKSLGKSIGKIGHKAFFALQVFGCSCLAISGVVEGQWGRAETGAGNLTKNFIGLANEKKISIFKKMNSDTARYSLMGLSVATNLPLLLSTFASAETSRFEVIASVCVVTAYSLLTLPGIAKLKDHAVKKVKDIAKNNMFFKNNLVSSNSSAQGVIKLKFPPKTSRLQHFNRKAMNVTQEWVAPGLLAVRAVARLADGIVRTDVAAMLAGAAFITAIPTLALGNRHRRIEQEKKTLLENKNKNKNAPNAALIV